jgi:hypothetical protein
MRNEMGKACSTLGGEEDFDGGSQKERNHYEDLDLSGRVILRWIFEK